ncbi:MAG: YbaK/EbsC family protein [Nitriliruptoraceae bacterium]
MAPSGPTRFDQRARTAGFTPDIRAFPEGTRTARDAAAAIGCDLAQIVKSLVFLADGRGVLVLTSGANQVDETRLAATLGAAEVRRASADEVRATTGYPIGGTPPFGLDTDLDVLCDEDLCTHGEVWAAAGSPTSVFAIAPDRLVALTGARVTVV